MLGVALETQQAPVHQSLLKVSSGSSVGSLREGSPVRSIQLTPFENDPFQINRLRRSNPKHPTQLHFAKHTIHLNASKAVQV